MKDFNFDEQTHTYRLGDEVLPSVTEIVGMIDFGALAKVSPAMLQYAAQRGTLVHEYTEAIDNGYDPEELEIETDLTGYVKAYLDFLRDYRPKWELVEEKLCFNLDIPQATAFAGTLDRFGEIDRKKCIVDIKTTSTADRHTKLKWALQLCGYEHLLIANDIIDDFCDHYVLQLKKDGTYTLHDLTETFEGDTVLFAQLLCAAKIAKGMINNE